MKRSHFTSEQIVFALRQAETRAPAAEVLSMLFAAVVTGGV